MKRTQTRARVTLTVEIDLSQPWGPDATMGDVFKRATQDAIGAVRRGLSIHHMTTGSDAKTPARIIGDPKVVAILVDGDSPEGPSE